MAKDKGKKEKKAKKGKSDKKGKSEAKPKQSGEAKVVRQLDCSVALSKLKHAIMKKKNKKGDKVSCIIILIEDNFFIEKDGAVYMSVRMHLKDGEDQYKQHGFMAHQIPSEIYKKLSDKQKEKSNTQILGGLKDWDFAAGSTKNDASGSAGEMEENDDLPF